MAPMSSACVPSHSWWLAMRIEFGEDNADVLRSRWGLNAQKLFDCVYQQYPSPFETAAT